MLVADSLTTVDTSFLQPLSGLPAASLHARPCPEFTDANFPLRRVQRGLESSESGCAFLQAQGVRFENTPGHSNYFAALPSERRRIVLRDVHGAILTAANLPLHARLSAIPELAVYDCFGTDGRWHKSATYDARHRVQP